MTDKNDLPSSILQEFGLAKRIVCDRYAALRTPSSVRHLPAVIQNPEKKKSSAQVATSVGHQAVRRKSCGLKPGDLRQIKITTRFAILEREFLVGQAGISCLTVSEYIRISALGPGYAAVIDPMKRQLLQDILRELNRQGTNLNQLARHLNTEMLSADQGAEELALLSEGLMAAQRAVRKALAEGQSY